MIEEDVNVATLQALVCEYCSDDVVYFMLDTFFDIHREEISKLRALIILDGLISASKTAQFLIEQRKVAYEFHQRNFDKTAEVLPDGVRMN
jgi:hypothetical protein